MSRFFITFSWFFLFAVSFLLHNVRLGGLCCLPVNLWEMAVNDLRTLMVRRLVFTFISKTLGNMTYVSKLSSRMIVLKNETIDSWILKWKKKNNKKNLRRCVPYDITLGMVQQWLAESDGLSWFRGQRYCSLVFGRVCSGGSTNDRAPWWTFYPAEEAEHLGAAS